MDLALFQTTLLYLLAAPPLAFIICSTSSARERFTNVQNRTQLLRIYKQHAILIEILQYTTVLLILRPIFQTADAGITTTDLFCSLLLGLANLATFLTINTIDAWRLPRCWDEVFDPMFRVTRDRLYDCRFSVEMHLSLWIEWLTVAETGILPRSPPPPGPLPRASAKSDSGGSASFVISSRTETPAPPGAAPADMAPVDPCPGELPLESKTQQPECNPVEPTKVEERRVRFELKTPPPAPPLPKLPRSLTSRPHYECQTLSSASRSVKAGAK